MEENDREWERGNRRLRVRERERETKRDITCSPTAVVVAESGTVFMQAPAGHCY